MKNYGKKHLNYIMYYYNKDLFKLNPPAFLFKLHNVLLQ